MASGNRRQNSNTPSSSPERQRLYRYCSNLRARLRNAGYHVVDHKQVKQALDQRSYNSDLARKIGHIQQAEARNNNLLRQIAQGKNAYVNPGVRLIALPRSKGALKNLAREHDLNPDKLAQAGLSDIHIHAKYLMHEASHVMGRDGRYWQDQTSYDANEASTYLHDMMRFMHVTGFKPTDCVPNFLADYFNITNTMAALTYHENADHKSANAAYKWTNHAIQWAITRANKAGLMDGLWDKRSDRFYPGALQQHFAHHDVPDPGEAYGYLYDMARRYLKDRIVSHYGGTRKSFFNDRGNSASYAEWRDMAWRAGRDALADARHAKQDSISRQKGNTDAEKAALILRQLARSIDHVRRYSDNYMPPASGVRITHRCPVPAYTPG